MYYLLANLRNFNRETLEGALVRRHGTTMHSCREVVNREFHRKGINFIAASTNGSSNSPFLCMEVLTNTEYVTKLLQEILNTDSMICSNRFFYCTSQTNVISPRGSLISGILKMIVSHQITSTTYDKFKEDLIRLCISTDTLGDRSTGLSVGIAIKLFSEFSNLPTDPSGDSGYGTAGYLMSVKRGRSLIKAIGEESYLSLGNYFNITLGVHTDALSVFL